MLIVKTKDCPDANGRKPELGERKYKLLFPLEDGDSLIVETGREALIVFRKMFEQMDIDDLADGEERDFILQQEEIICRLCGKTLTVNTQDKIPMTLFQTAHAEGWDWATPLDGFTEFFCSSCDGSKRLKEIRESYKL